MQGQPDNTNALAAGTGSVNVEPTSDVHALMGFSCRETAGATAVFRVHDGNDASGKMLVPVSLAANESRADQWANGLKVLTGNLFVERVSGTTEICIHWS